MRAGCENLSERATDLWRRAAKMTEDVGALKTAAEGALEEGKETATRAVEEVRRRARDLRQMPEDLVSHVRHEPWRAMGVAIGVGLVAGGLFGWFVARKTHNVHS